MSNVFINKKKIIFLLFCHIFLLINAKAFSNNIDKDIYMLSYINGIKLANASGKLILKRNNFSVYLNARTVGLFSLLTDWKQNIESNGIYYESILKSSIYRSKDSRGDKKGHMFIDFNKPIPELISAQPDPRKDNRRRKIESELLYNTLDPFIGIINIGINGKCNPSTNIFDGKRKYIIRSEKVELSKFKADNFFEEDFDALKCKFYIDKIAGYTAKEKKKYPSTGYIWIKKLYNYTLYFPVKIEIETKWGNFVSLIKERNKKSESDSL